MIKVYSIPSCPYCVELKQKLMTENIEFKDVDVSRPENEAEYNKIVKISKCDEVPVVLVGSQLLIPNTSFSSIDEAVSITNKFLG